MKRLLRTLILTIVCLYGRLPVRRAQRRQQGAAPRILLVRPDHLGDMILVTPILNALAERLPGAQITMLVGPWSSEVVKRHPAVSQVIPCAFPGFQRAPQKPLEPYKLLFQVARQLQVGDYDVAINLRPDFWWGAALLYLARIPLRIGYAITPNTRFLTNALPFPAAEHATVSNLRLASAALQVLGAQPLDEPYLPTRYPLVFTPDDNEREQVRQRLLAAQIQPQEPVVVIHPGTGGAVKLWRDEGWAHVAQWLQSQRIGSAQTEPRVILTGSPSELPMLKDIAAPLDAAVAPLLISDVTIGELAALLERAQLVLGVDNGPLHLATAQNTPTLRIFGPTDERIFGPWGTPERHSVLRTTEPCPGCPIIPCGRLDFTAEELAAHPCVKRITEQQVEQAIQAFEK